MHTSLLTAAAILGGIGVIAGAFGAHALRAQLSESSLAAWQTAVQYQLLHAVAIVGVAILAAQLSARGASMSWMTASGWCFVAGIVLFSGSLYVLALVGGPRWLGPVTPLGGLGFIAGWVCLGVAAARAA